MPTPRHARSFSRLALPSRVGCALIAVMASMTIAGSPGTGVELAVRADVEGQIERSGADVAVAFRTLDGGYELFLQPDVEFHAASTMKVPVMIELYRQARAGALYLDDRVPGHGMSYRELCETMITASSNLAANLLIERLGPQNIQRTTDALGARGMRVLRGVEDNKAFARGFNNTTTARALLTLMEKIARGEAVDTTSSGEMVAVLKRQKFHDRIPAGLPPGIPVAHKTGEITRIQHDAAIVYAERPFVLVILIRGLDDAKQGSALAAALTRTIYAAVTSG